MTARDRRALLVGGATIVLGLLLARGVPGVLRAEHALRTHATEQVAALARAREVLAAREAVRDSLAAALSALVALAPTLVSGGGPSDATAALSAEVTRAAESHGLGVVRLTPRVDSAAGVFRPATVAAELEGDLAGLARFLRAVERGDPLLSVRSLAVSSPGPLSGLAPGPVRIEVEVVGWYLGEERR